MSEIITIEGLPKIDQVLPKCFKPISLQVTQPYYKESFMVDYGMYCALKGSSSKLCTDAIRTVLVKDKMGNALMYAYDLNIGDEYILLEVGKPQVYKVSKDKIVVEDVEYHRLPFADTEKGLTIMVRNDKDERYAHELWLRDAETGKETRLDFSGGTMKKGYEFLQKEGLVQ